ncbi:hypothetical protein CEXT_155331 [Caerostris extrusa]|uniref:Uncharacterized protein n=1 Tax=Caerostris extrusa TaxID=172846 RepID=A0AAV4SJ61_CAEEX|nr:hypothetical protein CEXT_155331 [Caerostris extrusa]
MQSHKCEKILIIKSLLESFYTRVHSGTLESILPFKPDPSPHLKGDRYSEREILYYHSVSNGAFSFVFLSYAEQGNEEDARRRKRSRLCL